MVAPAASKVKHGVVSRSVQSPKDLSLVGAALRLALVFRGRYYRVLIFVLHYFRFRCNYKLQYASDRRRFAVDSSGSSTTTILAISKPWSLVSKVKFFYNNQLVCPPQSIQEET